MNSVAAKVVQEWSEHLYLIGCHADVQAPGPVSAQSLGFKAYNLMRIAALGLRVPPAFVLGTEYCKSSETRARATQSRVWSHGIGALERATGQKFGDARAPLLVSVRSGAPVSMPGMMDTLLNVGLCDRTLGGFLRQTGNPRLVWDTYRRLVRAYGELVAGVAERVFDDEYRACVGARDDRSLDFVELRELTHRYLGAYARESGQSFPQDPALQIKGAIAQVLSSWQSPRACEYRRQCGIDDAIGTAVTVQAMVFGNAGGRSGSGVAFTRNPLDGTPSIWVDFLVNSQGEDVVSGKRVARDDNLLARSMPDVWTSLTASAATLEHALGDMQDIEFTVQEGQLYLLQTRSGKRSTQAAARIALDLFDEGVITAGAARELTAALNVADLVTMRLASDDGKAPVPLAHAASGNLGIASGEIAFDAERALERCAKGAAVVLVRRDADTADIAPMQAAVGLLTRNGARTSHAAVVARQLGKVCLVGCTSLNIDESEHTLSIGQSVLREGDQITIDGNAGAVYAGAVRAITEPMEGLQERLRRLRSN
jgi:pyruvate,orthophosphate dikinase